jgi:aminoglycoside 3-N-acetyltransferase
LGRKEVPVVNGRKPDLPQGFVSQARTLYKRYRRVYNRLQQARYAPLDAAQFRSILTDCLGIGKGDVVFVHSSMDKLAATVPASEVLTILKDVVGSAGTLVFPTYPRLSSYEFLCSGEVFDVRKTPSYSGLLTELARREPGAARSLHPTKSVCAIGPAAKSLIEAHSESPYPYDECSPYYRIMAYKGKIIGLGVATDTLSFVHCVDDAMKDRFPVAPYHPKLWASTCRDHSGQLVTVATYAHDMAKMKHNVPRFLKRYVARAIGEDVGALGRRFFRCHARQLFDHMLALAAHGYTIYPRSVYR